MSTTSRHIGRNPLRKTRIARTWRFWPLVGSCATPPKIGRFQATLISRGQYIPRRPWIVSIAEETLQEGLPPSGYTAVGMEAMLAAVARRGLRGPEAMKNVAAGPEPVLRPTAGDVEVQYLPGARALRLSAPQLPEELELNARAHPQELVGGGASDRDGKRHRPWNEAC